MCELQKECQRMDLVISTEHIYWPEIERKLHTFVKDFNNKKLWSEQNKIKLQNKVNLFCSQGTGFQRCLYKFVRHRFEEKTYNPILTKIEFDQFVGEITVICIYLDTHYLRKHPRKKKTIKSIKDAAEWYWRTE